MILKGQVVAHDLAEALTTYDRQPQESAADRQLHVRAGLILAEAFVTTNPPKDQEASRLLSDLGPLLDEASLPGELKQLHRWWTFLAHLKGVNRVLTAEASSYEEWHTRLLALASDLPPERPQAGIVVETLHHIAAEPAAKEAAAVDRLDQILLDLQCVLVTQHLITPLQQCRLRLMSSAGRQPDSLFEARVLLALVAQDPADLPDVISGVEAVLKQTSGNEESGQTMRLFQLWGAEGPDGIGKTADDIVNPLAQATRDNPYLAKKLAKLQENQTTGTAERLALGYGLILAGKPEDARKCLLQLIAPGALPHESEFDAVLNGIAIADSLADGHMLASHRSICNLLSAKEASSLPATWRYKLWCFPGKHLGDIQALLVTDYAPAGLMVCRNLLNDWPDPEQRDELLNLTMQGCKTLAKDGSPASWLQRFLELGKTIRDPGARLNWACTAAEQSLQAGQTETALQVLEGTDQSPGSPTSDPEAALLRALCLVRVGKPDKAIDLIKGVPDNANASPAVAARAQLLLVAIFLQDGRVFEARETLDRLVRDYPGTEYDARARAILEKI